MESLTYRTCSMRALGLVMDQWARKRAFGIIFCGVCMKMTQTILYCKIQLALDHFVVSSEMPLPKEGTGWLHGEL
eukprot:145400-Pelagomonas_calceolata.AAC.5